MSPASIDALTSGTLKYLRERWWNDDFTDFLAEPDHEGLYALSQIV